MQYQQLKDRQREERHGYPSNLSLRVHRALSWLQRSEMADDPDGTFIFQWIAFNAAYATELDPHYRSNEQSTFQDFLQKLCDLDTQHRLEALTWGAFPKSIRLLLDNPYVFQNFWHFQNGRISEQDWKAAFSRSKAAAGKALGNRNTAAVLGIVLNRTYTLRNQLIHGGATWNSSVNRDQIRDCVALMGQLVPVIVTIMMDHPGTLWGEGCYPVVEAQ